MACNCKNKNNSSKAVQTPIKTNHTTSSVSRPSTQQKRIMRREIK